MAVTMQDETWPELGEFVIISTKIGENQNESLLYNKINRRSVNEIGNVYL